MANYRVIIPRKVDKLLVLAKCILDKHAEDGEHSPLAILDMVEMNQLYESARHTHEEAQRKERHTRAATEQRDAALGLKKGQGSFTRATVLFYVTSIRDNLLGVHKREERKLGLWGYEVNSGGSSVVVIPIPRNPQQMITLAQQILERHEADTPDSLLNSFDMEELSTLVEWAAGQHELALRLSREKEEHFESRNRFLGYAGYKWRIEQGTLLYYITACRDVLKGVHRTSEKNLGLWGFEVDTYIAPGGKESVL